MPLATDVKNHRDSILAELAAVGGWWKVEMQNGAAGQMARAAMDAILASDENGPASSVAMHDPRFKRLLQEFFAEFFWLFFPDWAARFDFSGLEWLDKELLTDALKGESRYVDVVAKLPMLEPASSASERQSAENWLALVHVEIEAADKVAPLRRRMFHYYDPLRRRHDLPVLPIGVFVKTIGWASPFRP